MYKLILLLSRSLCLCFAQSKHFPFIAEMADSKSTSIAVAAHTHSLPVICSKIASVLNKTQHLLSTCVFVRFFIRLFAGVGELIFAVSLEALNGNLAPFLAPVYVCFCVFCVCVFLC